MSNWKLKLKKRCHPHYHPPKFLRYKSNKICIKSTQRETYNSNKRNKERLNIVHSWNQMIQQCEEIISSQLCQQIQHYPIQHISKLFFDR